MQKSNRNSLQIGIEDVVSNFAAQTVTQQWECRRREIYVALSATEIRLILGVCGFIKQTPSIRGRTILVCLGEIELASNSISPTTADLRSAVADLGTLDLVSRSNCANLVSLRDIDLLSRSFLMDATIK